MNSISISELFTFWLNVDFRRPVILEIYSVLYKFKNLLSETNII